MSFEEKIEKLGKWGTFLKFAMVGGSAFLIDFAIFNILAIILHTHGFSHIGPLTIEQFSQYCSVACVTPISYILNKRFTFKSNKRKRDTVIPFIVTTLFTGLVVQERIIDFIVYVVGPWGVNQWWIFQNPNIYRMFAKMAAVGIGMVVNFMCYHFIFKEKTEEAVEESLSEL
jgi:putative flippase GtrA